MRNTTRKGLALILAVLQLAVLFPLTAFAEDSTTTNETPVLNEMKVGTVAFQSFNFLGDNDTGEDGTDYHTTFYYTDDYFAPSAINDAATSRTMLWSDLDNLELATCSFDFAIASYTSAEGDVIRASSQTWNNTDYSNKDKNIKQFLGDCGFTNIEPHALTERPTNDSIGYTLASKEITVWNADTRKNETYTLIAVGVRGAGYGAEWASNITIGDPSTNALPANGRHYGFDHSAQIVCDGIRNYLSSHSISGNVKYWVTGFSRAAAVANLVAGYLTDNGSTYKTQQKDVYGYTWECPQAAATANTNFTNYKNIHNILNPMDAVPKVSPDDFNHQRLGVDYQMPYHGHVDSGKITSSKHTNMYNQMFEVLKTVAVGNGTDPDPLVDDKTTTNVANDGYVSPSKYPYNKVMTIYKMDGSDMISQAIAYATASESEKPNSKLLKEFGTVEAEQYHGGLTGRRYGNVSWLLRQNKIGSDYKTTDLYIDTFVDSLIKVFLESKAWSGNSGDGENPLTNRNVFISQYQDKIRTLLGYFLDFSGPAFMDMIDKLVGGVTDNIVSTQSVGFAANFVAFYNFGLRKSALIESSKTMAVKVANSMTNGFNDPQGISREQMNAALEGVVSLVINLYDYELGAYDSQYLGTTLRYLNTILCTHEQETVLSWIMSLDSNHMNRSCRTLTVPASADVTLYEFRDQYGEQPTDEETTAQIVAFWKDGVLNSKDDRITKTVSGDNVIIRYPASLKIRADVKATMTLNLNTVKVADYQTTSAYTHVSDGELQYQNAPSSYNYLSEKTNSTSITNASTKNSNLSSYGTISAGDTLHVLVNDMTAYNSENTKYELSIDRVKTEITEYAAPNPGLTTGASKEAAVTLDGKSSSKSEEMYRGILTRTTTTTIPASSVYFDDDFSTPVTDKNPGDSVYSTMSQLVNTTDGAKQLWFQFTGTRVDVYCTTDDSTGYVQAAVYQNVNGEKGQREGIVTIRSSSDTTRYNVPTISFDGLTPGQSYFLVLNVLSSSNYHLDGIRVYNSAATSNEDAVTFANLRELLLGKSDVAGLTSQTTDGAAFYVDHAEEGESHVMALTAENYANVSPKNELYLYNGQSVAFQINGTYDSVAVGMSAPENKGSGTVTVTNGTGTKQETISSVVDTYVTINPSDRGYVSIHNDTDVLISITNVRIEGFVPAVQGRSLVVSEGLKSYARSFLSLAAAPVVDEPEETIAPEVTPAVEEPEETPAPEETPEPTPTPTPTPVPTPTPTPVPTPTPTPLNISSFINAVFRSLSRLFRF